MKSWIIKILVLFFISSMAFAKSINLYEQPKSDSKVVGTLDTSAGIIPIFTPKDSNWIKVADPRNGNVGWIPNSDFKSLGFSYQILQTGDGKKNYQVIQFGNPPSPASEKAWREMQIRQQAIQKDMQKMMQDMFSDFPAGLANYPVVVPVVVPQKPAVPVQEKKQ